MITTLEVRHVVMPYLPEAREWRPGFQTRRDLDTVPARVCAKCAARDMALNRD